MKRFARILMLKVLMVILCVQACGCASFSQCVNLKKEAVVFRQDLAKKEELLLSKEEEIKNLQALLKEKEDKLNERDLELQQLRKKLEGFGVFNP